LMMSELKQYDDTVYDEDEYETPSELYNKLCFLYGVKPALDVAADSINRKCLDYYDRQKDGLSFRWTSDVWCNPPHTKTGAFVRKAYNEWSANNINIMMIIPTNTMSSKFWHHCIENIAETHAILGRIRFRQFGRLAPSSARNAYVCVIWRKRIEQPAAYVSKQFQGQTVSDRKAGG
jgi:phage N-6-adenine-methyltransferase